MLKALLVDDERLARAELRLLLAEFPDRIKVIGEAANKNEAVRFINSPENPRPDVVFLDISMPRGSGFDVLDDIDYQGSHPIHIVFVTSYNKYAVRAFTVNALDYVLKPIDEKRLELTLERLEKARHGSTVHQSLVANPDAARHAATSDETLDDEDISLELQELTLPEGAEKLTLEDFVFLTIDKTMVFVPLPEIVWITANGNYSELWLHEGKHSLILRTMNEWEVMLPTSHFLRIHRKTIINRAYIDETRPKEMIGSSAQIYLRDIKEPFALSRRYLAKLKEML
jgi:two-component system LytT family response regulator